MSLAHSLFICSGFFCLFFFFSHNMAKEYSEGISLNEGYMSDTDFFLKVLMCLVMFKHVCP